MLPIVSLRVLFWRRWFFLVANVVTYVGIVGALAYGLGWSWLNLAVVLCFGLFVPWSILGFWNAAISVPLLFAPRRVEPAGNDGLPRTAILMTLRNEDPERALQRLRIVRDSLEATGFGARFGYFVLSDTSDPGIAEREEASVLGWMQYRRREVNAGFKAGNIMDFCDRWGSEFELMLPLDADSLMAGEAILHLVRIMRDNPGFGIVQGLVAGLPAANLFARMFQFGMRHGMRSYTLGQAWWTADCGPFWGHNAIIRIAPFRQFCRLPVLPGRAPLGGPILSHDQVEAALMRRGGFEVRLQPVAGGSWEDNPPTILDYVRRDLRWCQGNLQYLRLLGMPGLRPVSRFQLIWAILMFIGIPAWTVLIGLVPVVAWVAVAPQVEWLEGVYWAFLLMFLAPKLVGYLHTAVGRRRRSRYGGFWRFAAGVAGELVFSLLQTTITSLHVTGFIVALVAGRSVRWAGQARDTRRVLWREAAWAFWPQTLFGVVFYGALGVVAPALLAWAAPFTLGYLVAIPFAVLTASRRWPGLCVIPEDLCAPLEVRSLMRVTG